MAQTRENAQLAIDTAAGAVVFARVAGIARPDLLALQPSEAVDEISAEGFTVRGIALDRDPAADPPTVHLTLVADRLADTTTWTPPAP